MNPLTALDYIFRAGLPWEKSHYVIIANVAGPDVGLRMGARVEVLAIPGDPRSVEVRGMSRGGRRITKWVATNRLRNFRSTWQHMPIGLVFETRESAERTIAERLSSSAKDTK